MWVQYFSIMDEYVEWHGEVKVILLQKAREASCTLAVTSSGNSSPRRIVEFTLFVQRWYYTRHISETEGAYLWLDAKF